MKTRIAHRSGRISLVLDEPGKAVADSDMVADMEQYEGTDCWSLTDIRLSRFINPSPYAGSLCAAHTHCSYKPESTEIGAFVKSKLREYSEYEDGRLRWCTFEGIVRGHPSINGNAPAHYRGFNQAGYFSRAEGLLKLEEIQKAWDGVTPESGVPRIANPFRQPMVADFIYEAGMRDSFAIACNQRIEALPVLKSRAGVEYALWKVATEAIQEASGNAAAVNWRQVSERVARESIVLHRQQREQVWQVLKEHSPLTVSGIDSASLQDFVGLVGLDENGKAHGAEIAHMSVPS